MIDKTITIGVLGCSNIAKRSVIPALQYSNKYNLIGVAAREKERAISYVEGLGQVKAYTYEELCADPAIDAIYISTPVGCHYKWALRALEHGKHVLVEKTFTHNVDTAEELIRVATNNKLVIAEALQYIYHPLHSTVMNLLQGGGIGEILNIQATFTFPHLPVQDIRYNPTIGGGALFDTCIYPLSFIQNIVGELPKTLDFLGGRQNGYSVDTYGMFQGSHKEITFQALYGFGYQYRNTYTITGAEGVLTAHRVFSRPPGFRDPIVLQKGIESKQVEVAEGNSFLNMFEHFADVVAGIASPTGLNYGESLLHRMEIIENFKLRLQS